MVESEGVKTVQFIEMADKTVSLGVASGQGLTPPVASASPTPEPSPVIVVDSNGAAAAKKG